MDDDARRKSISERLAPLRSGQLEFIDRILTQLQRTATFTRDPKSDIVSECVLHEFGDVLRIHHSFSVEAFTKDRFEFALEKACNACKIPAARASRNNPGA